MPEVRPRPLGDVTEDAIKAFDDIARLTLQPQQSASGSGSADGGRLTITLSKTGLTSCTADPRWVSNQTAARLMNALSEALTAAKDDLANKPENSESTNSLDHLLAEAMALLNNPNKLAD